MNKWSASEFDLLEGKRYSTRPIKATLFKKNYSRINCYNQHCLNVHHHLSSCSLLCKIFHFQIDLFSESHRSVLFLPKMFKIVIAHVISNDRLYRSSMKLPIKELLGKFVFMGHLDELLREDLD